MTRGETTSARKLRLAMVVVASLCAIGMIAGPAAQAQTFQVIHAFTGGSDGANPLGRVILDGGGHLYGTAYSGGTYWQGGPGGVVFRMSPQGSGWLFNPIFAFNQESDGDDPYNGVVFGPGGLLYGTTENGGSVFTARPQATRPTSALAPWNLNFLYDLPWFVYPAGDLIFDGAGNIYAATSTGGNHGCFNNEGCGMVYELTPSGGGWSEQPLYIFQGGTDGNGPDGVIFDAAGDLLGTASNGGAFNAGVIFQLTPSGNGWTKSIVYNFNCQGNGGCAPVGGLVADASGNLYGSTVASSQYSGVIFELSPSNGGWIYNVIAQIPPQYQFGPTVPLTMDAAGNLYGTIGTRNSFLPGAVFKLTHGNNGWTFTSLHDFTGGSDGGSAASTVAIDANGNLYGTTYYGGPNCLPNGCGVVWEITP